ncbi:surF1 family protein [Phenylobacterium zucineum HLK1]|uniref:SURF1-like protein n=1 Tax=Phenylobacterium zucineum (strain HLK1) TaxID=450851 RepID=B4REX4_PHEZH|nr:SURF1 family cytochrome oxidase biogenesis protein [Phenylobacterium zucineum]ACG76962.1 surF1 family protein [Phenylobacterium zucineum HLK1]
MTDARRFPLGLTIATAISLAILLTLGTWQLQRLAWKRDLIARIEALQTAPARPLGPVLAAAARGEDVDFVRVAVTCPGLASAPYLELYGLREGQAGARLISACPAEGGGYGSILVDRGFVPDTVSARPPVDAADARPLEVTGVLRAPDAKSTFSPPNRPDRWFTRDIPAMAAALGAADPAPVFLMAETSSNPEWKGLTPAPVPANISNRHLEYAVTWYGLAAALLGVYAAMLLKRRKT